DAFYRDERADRAGASCARPGGRVRLVDPDGAGERQAAVRPPRPDDARRARDPDEDDAQAARRSRHGCAPEAAHSSPEAVYGRVKVALVGGTGPAGIGLGARAARAGHEVLVGSRSEERAHEAAAKILELAGTGNVSGGMNEQVIAPADVVVLSVHAEAQPEAMRALAGLLDGKIVVSMA